MIIFMTTVAKKPAIIVHLASKKTAYYSLQSCEQNQKYSVIYINPKQLLLDTYDETWMRPNQKRTVSL